MPRAKRRGRARAQRRFRRIIVAVDFSAGSSAALGRLRSLPLARSTSVHLVHVIAAPTLVPLAVARQMAGERLTGLVKQTRRRSAGARVTFEITSGRPADELVRIARQRRADLIVAGRRGAGGFPRLLLGSTAERLTRLSIAPLLLIADARPAYRRVLLPLDVTENVEPIVRAAMQLLPASARLDLLHVYWAFGEGYLRFGGASPKAIHAHRRMVRTQAEEGIEPILQSLAGAGFRATSILLNGDPRQVVPRVIRARKPDLIVIGNHGRNALSRALIGSAAREVLACAKCDVFLVPVA